MNINWKQVAKVGLIVVQAAAGVGVALLGSAISKEDQEKTVIKWCEQNKK